MWLLVCRGNFKLRKVLWAKRTSQGRGRSWDSSLSENREAWKRDPRQECKGETGQSYLMVWGDFPEPTAPRILWGWINFWHIHCYWQTQIYSHYIKTFVRTQSYLFASALKRNAPFLRWPQFSWALWEHSPKSFSVLAQPPSLLSGEHSWLHSTALSGVVELANAAHLAA